MGERTQRFAPLFFGEIFRRGRPSGGFGWCWRGYTKGLNVSRIKGRDYMDEKQQKQVNEAAEKFADAIKESYQALADRSVSAQELNAQLTQEFFNGVINNLRTQAESNRALAEDLIEQQRKQQEASQTLTQESVNAYMDFLGSVFAYPYQGTRVASPQQGTEPGDGAAIAEDNAVRHPLNTWVRTSGRSRTRGRAARSRGRSSRR